MVTSTGRSVLAAADWQLRARCKDQSGEPFYPPDQEKASARRRRELRAKQICLACPVLEPCRRYAIDAREPHGIWGATTPRDRERLVPCD
jgi:WhiB family redox-sensing transcriptional regulator